MPIRANPEFYRNVLSPVEFSAIVDWRAVERGQFSKALGRRGALCALARRIQQLRALEIAPPPPPPPLQEWDPPSINELLQADTQTVPPAQDQDQDTNITHANVTAMHVPPQDIAQDDVEIIEPPQARPVDVTSAATAYIQRVGAATSHFMITMSNATTDFVQQASTFSSAAAPSSSSSRAIMPQCPICFDTVKDPYMGRCSHVYCKECLLNPQMRTEVVNEYGNINALRVRRCPQCRREGVSFYKMLS